MKHRAHARVVRFRLNRHPARRGVTRRNVFVGWLRVSKPGAVEGVERQLAPTCATADAELRHGAASR